MMTLKHAKSLAVACALAVLASACGLSAFAKDSHTGQKTGQKFGAKKEEFRKEFYDEVKATPEQRKKLDELNTQFETEVNPLRQSFWDKKKSLVVYVISPHSTQTEAMQKEAEIDQLKTKIDKLYLDHVFQKKAVLTPEQQQKAADFFKRKSDEWHKKMEEKESTETKG